MTTVYAFMVADLFHYGHLEALRQAKELGDYLIVGILTDRAAEPYKRKPVIPLRERMAIVEHCDYVDEVVIQKSTDPSENLKRLQPDLLVHGDDWGDGFPGSEHCKVVMTKYYKGRSTTRIMDRIKNEY